MKRWPWYNQAEAKELHDHVVTVEFWAIIAHSYELDELTNLSGYAKDVESSIW